MPSYSVSGIVLGRTNFGEADRIIRLISPERGKISVVARGVRKIKSRSAGHLELFGETSLMLATGHNLDIITSARLIWYPHQLINDYAKISLAYACAALIDRTAQEHTPQPELYHHLNEMLHVIEAGHTEALAELWFKLRLLQLTGYRPELTACVGCAQASPDQQYYFDTSRGGIACRNCASATAPTVDQTIIKLWRLLSDYSFATVVQITNAPALAEQSLKLCDNFYEEHLGRAFRPGIVA